MRTFFLLLGTNLGDKPVNLEEAILHISALIGEIITKSSIYRTEAWGKTDQEDFLNQVVSISSEIDAEEVLALCLEVENIMGRIRYEKWGERLIDIDILYCGEQVIETEELKVPHPELQNRRFTMIPLAEIASDFVHPIIGKTNSEILDACTDQLKVYKYKI